MTIMKEKMSWLRWPLEHYSISLLIVGILFVLGIYGMYVMPEGTAWMFLSYTSQHQT